MKKTILAVAALMLLSAPTAAADDDPYIPNAAAGYCPGGGGLSFCRGVPFEDGTYFEQGKAYTPSGPFGPVTWGAAHCYMSKSSWAPPSGCNGQAHPPGSYPE